MKKPNWCNCYVFILVLLFPLVVWRALVWRTSMTFDAFIRGKDIVICGNSPEFDTLYSQLNITNNSVVVRFNDAIKYYPRSSTDVYVYGRAIARKYTRQDIDKLKTEYRFVFGHKCDEPFRTNHILDTIDIENPTTGFRFLTWMLTKQHLVKSITILGFNMKSSKAHRFDNIKFATRHDRVDEPNQLKRLVDKYNVTYLQTNPNPPTN